MYIYKFKFMTKSQENTDLYKSASSDNNCLVIQLTNRLFCKLLNREELRSQIMTSNET